MMKSHSRDRELEALTAFTVCCYATVLVAATVLCYTVIAFALSATGETLATFVRYGL